MRRSLDRKMDAILERENQGRIKENRIKNRTVNKFLTNRLSLLGLALFTLILLASVFAPLLTSYAPTQMNLRAILQAPDFEHLFGTDKIGRDVFTRILYGGRVSIFVGLGSAILSAAIGVTLGIYCGYVGGYLDNIVMKISEALLSFPQIILVMLLVTITGQSLWNLIFIFSLTGWPSMYRMARSQVLSIREEEYVQALQAFGIRKARIAFRHILPNCIGPIFVNITLSTANFIIQETSLSFLGLGVPLEVATWGNIINAAQDITILKDNIWVWLPAGIVVTLFVMSINFIGDGMRDASDPSQLG